MQSGARSAPSPTALLDRPADADADHPLWADETYRARRDEIAALAAGPHQRPVRVQYGPAEDETWAAVNAALRPVWDAHVCEPLLAARERLDLPIDRVAQLSEVTERLAPISGFAYEAVPGLVSKEEFFGALAEHRFLSTQFVRHPAQPLYTPEPDVVHEVIGHAHCLAEARLAELHRLAGEAMNRVQQPETRQFLSDVFWFSGEFGVVQEAGGWKAYGAGLLSSVGELGWFAGNAEVRPVDPITMGSFGYDITHYQPVLFGASNLDEVLDVVGGFFAAVTDDQISAHLAGAVEG